METILPAQIRVEERAAPAEYWHITYFGIPTQQEYPPQYRAVVVACSIADWIKSHILGPTLLICIVSAWPLTKHQYDEIHAKMAVKP